MARIIDIKDAFEAMDSGRTTKCLNTGLFYRKCKDSCYYETSKTFDFNDIWATISSFTEDQIIADWEIVEQEVKIKPCLYCGSETDIYSAGGQYFIGCIKISCRAWNGNYSDKKEAICKHNELYDKLNPPVKSNLLNANEMAKGLYNAGASDKEMDHFTKLCKESSC